MGPIGPREGFQKSSKPSNLLSVELAAASWQLPFQLPYYKISICSMPKLKSRDTHECIICESSFKRRSILLEHFTLLGANGKPRCPGLNDVIPVEVWDQQIVTFYRDDAHVPDLSQFQKCKKSPGEPCSYLRCWSIGAGYQSWS